MTVDTLIKGVTQLVTPRGSGARHGRAMRELDCVENAAIAIDRGRFVWVGRLQDWSGEARRVVDLGGRAVVPGLVDPHTHAVWAGDRLGDFALRTSGAGYEQILAAGGGIRSSIRATQNASNDELVSLAEPRLQALIHCGATVIEVKSGYGFTPPHEIRMLEVVRTLQAMLPARLVPTLLIHVPPSESSGRPAYLHSVVSQLIPEVAQRRLATAVDIFVERESFTVAEAEPVLRCALDHGVKIKIHSEQFHAVGGMELAVGLGALSVDHLEALQAYQYAKLAGSATIATILPGVSLHLGIPAAAGRRLIDAGTAIAVGTDLNPGSSPLYSTAAALALAVRLNGLSAEEALVAGTVNAAAALGLKDAGRIEAGLQADFAVLHSDHWQDLVYALGTNPVKQVWIKGSNIDAGE